MLIIENPTKVINKLSQQDRMLVSPLIVTESSFNERQIFLSKNKSNAELFGLKKTQSSKLINLVNKIEDKQIDSTSDENENSPVTKPKYRIFVTSIKDPLIESKSK